LKNRAKKDRETLEMEIDSMKMECIRTNANVTELQTQKSSMKN